MEQTPITINLPANYDGTKPIIIHHMDGKTPEPINYKPLSITGNIDAVSQWIKTRADHFKHELANIIMDAYDKSITLTIGEQHPHSTTITAKFTDNPELKKFGINEAKYFSTSELAQLLKLNRAYFASREQHSTLLASLKKHEAKITADLKDHDDDRGNTINSINVNLQSNVDEKFTMEMPLFKGSGKKVKFEVNIGIEVRDKGISLWLDSVELKELMLEAVEKEFESKYKEYTEAKFTVVVK